VIFKSLVISVLRKLPEKALTSANNAFVFLIFWQFEHRILVIIGYWRQANVLNTK
jgi:hypothetical protein